MTAEEVMDLLYERRAFWAAAIPEEGRDFYAFLRGGRDTMARFGVAFDYWRAEAGRGEPVAFVLRFGLGRTSGFSIRQYGEAIAHDMARAWAHKMQFFL